ncbi:MAG: hypothetical protein HY670_11295 [Chloroflexi bacterium]|nr:hypothetical protein [Chloroflexota bacterium]
MKTITKLVCKYVCLGCGYEALVPGDCPHCKKPLVASCPTCGNPVVGEIIRPQD